MSRRERYRLSPQTIVADQKALHALAYLPDFAPTNGAYHPERLRALEATMLVARAAADAAQGTADELRTQANATEQDFHLAIKGAKVQLKAQYGEDSPALTGVGLKRESERKRPARRTPAE